MIFYLKTNSIRAPISIIPYTNTRRTESGIMLTKVSDWSLYTSGNLQRSRTPYWGICFILWRLRKLPVTPGVEFCSCILIDVDFPWFVLWFVLIDTEWYLSVSYIREQECNFFVYWMWITRLESDSQSYLVKKINKLWWLINKGFKARPVVSFCTNLNDTPRIW